jgi:hypothetical protein
MNETIDKIITVLELHMTVNGQLSALEKDILDVTKTLSDKTFDYEKGNALMNYIYVQYPDSKVFVNTLPTTVKKENNKMTEEDIKYNLANQLEYLWGLMLKNGGKK